MARFVHYKCPDCTQIFRHLHHPSDAPPPDRCPLCGAWVSDEEPPEEVFIPQAPGIRKSAYAQSVDQTYRRMEEASIQRADEAADMLAEQYRADDRAAPHQGNPDLLSDFQKDQVAKMRSELKITDMKDPSQMREGDTAAVLPGAAEATRNLTTIAAKPGFQQWGGRVDYAPGAGPAGAGIAAHNKLTGHAGWQNGSPATANPEHQMRAAAMVRAGEMGRYSGR